MKSRIFSPLAAAVAAVIFSGAAFAAEINLNTADAQALATGLDGVGPTIAERIIDYREENGPFESVDQLVEVKGIGEKTLADNRQKLGVEASSE